MRFKALTLGILLLSLLSKAQTKDRSGFTYGGGFGVVVASGKNAMFYNGSPEKPNAVVSIIGNQAYKEQVYNVLKDDIKSISYPSKMQYSPAVTIQGYLAYILKNKSSFFGQLQYSQLSTNGVFSMKLKSPNTDSKIDEVKYYDGAIKAAENRVDIEFGYHIQLDNSNKTIPFIEVFGNVNTVTVKSDQMQIGAFTANLIQITVNNQFSNQGQGGTGYGFGTTFGIEAPMKAKMFYNLGLKGSLKTIHLFDKPSLTPHGDLFVRILF